MWSEGKRKRAAKRVKPGDGRELKRFRWWQPFTRSLFHLRARDETGQERIWSVDFRVMGDSDGEVRAKLYLDGRQHALAKLPAAFAVPGGTIEVDASGYGLRRCHFVSDDGTERQLTPDRRSAEGRRERLERERPGLSKTLGVLSVAVLVVALVLGLPQIVEQITTIPPVAERVGTFHSPVALPGWFNIGLTVAALLASTERALRLRYHWLLDGGLFDGDD